MTHDEQGRVGAWQHYNWWCDQIADIVKAREAPWREFALCKGRTDDFFLSRTQPTSKLSNARAICAECPVIGPCRDEADRFDDAYGIRAGEGVKDRRKRINSTGGYYVECREPGCTANAGRAPDRRCGVHHFRINRQDGAA